MTWLAISDGRQCHRQPGPEFRGALVPVGSLLIEVQLQGERRGGVTLLELERDTGWRHRLAVTLAPEGGLVVEHRQGAAVSVATLREPRLMANETLRLTWSWNAPARRGVLTAENTASGRLEQTLFDAPLPLPVEDVEALITGGAGVRLNPGLSVLAVSDEIEPVGPMPGFLSGSWVETAAGARPVEQLRPGDLVVTAERGLQPVRHAVARDVPAVGEFRPVRLRAPYFGLRTDLNLAPHHRVMIDGSDAEYLFGVDTVLVEARHLGPMTGRPSDPEAQVVRYHQIVLDGHACLMVAGTWAESLYLGQLARRPARHASSVLAHVPAEAIPVHEEIAGPLLKPFEAMVLVSNLCA
ncbi:Hint domain-containing protein [Psychromarinibacter sp. C21-152]|uniref:Hint domain-containing protein n=1 Tax=Psychromarinibacter sediminicola TaxID=3033385 RepID=A0AAE3NWN6_9RHOB|nr:Hint domain-containing protein [Psychromarinibacter sediminicola]MDF0602325.1 Hint domain-containing protein [Psychromarinibacter sediminicola]